MHVKATYDEPSEVLCAFAVSALNEFRIARPRVLVITASAYYRVSVNLKAATAEIVIRTPYDKVAGLELTPTGLRVHPTDAGRGSLGQTVSSLFNRADTKKVVREYLPIKPPSACEHRPPRADHIQHRRAQRTPRIPYPNRPRLHALVRALARRAARHRPAGGDNVGDVPEGR